MKRAFASHRIGSLSERDRVRHVREVDQPDLVSGRVAILVKSVARDGVGDDATARELDVVGAGKENRIWMRILDEARALRASAGPRFDRS